MTIDRATTDGRHTALVPLALEIASLSVFPPLSIQPPRFDLGRYCSFSFVFSVSTTQRRLSSSPYSLDGSIPAFARLRRTSLSSTPPIARFSSRSRGAFSQLHRYSARRVAPHFAPLSVRRHHPPYSMNFVNFTPRNGSHRRLSLASSAKLTESGPTPHLAPIPDGIPQSRVKAAHFKLRSAVVPEPSQRLDAPCQSRVSTTADFTPCHRRCLEGEAVLQVDTGGTHVPNTCLRLDALRQPGHRPRPYDTDSYGQRTASPASPTDSGDNVTAQVD